MTPFHAAVLALVLAPPVPPTAASPAPPSPSAATPFPGASAPAAAASDPRAVAIADRVMEALGGRAAWDRTRFLTFSFGSERDGRFQGRRHLWDKWTGRYRVEGTTREGEPFVILMNVGTREGSAWLGGRRLEGAELAQQLERGYGMWVNDTYWLLMPYKMRDPGVTLAYGGEDTMDGVAYDKVQLSFDNVGLTPKDRYWVWVNRDTGLVDRWDYVLKGEDAPPTTWRWSGWTKQGGILLAGERTAAADGRKLLLPGIAVLPSVPDAVFTDPQATY